VGGEREKQERESSKRTSESNSFTRRIASSTLPDSTAFRIAILSCKTRNKTRKGEKLNQQTEIS